MLEKECRSCKKIFKIKPSHFGIRFCCSKKCQNEYQKIMFKGGLNPNFKNAGNKKCLRCGKDFKSYIKERKYCSHRCADVSNRINPDFTQKELGIKQYIKKEYPCTKRKVGKRFYYYKKYFCSLCGTQEVKRKIKFCLNCRKIRSKIPVIGKLCGERSLSYRSRIKVFCNEKCKEIFYAGIGNPNYIDGRKPLTAMIRDCVKNKDLIIRTLQKDNYTCKLCGQIGGKLEVDHIKEFVDIFNEFLVNHKNLDIIKDKNKLFELSQHYLPFWDENNLRVLCKGCNWDKQVIKNTGSTHPQNN